MDTQNFSSLERHSSPSLRVVDWAGGCLLFVVLVLWWLRDMLCNTGKFVLGGNDLASGLDGKDLWPGFVWFLPNHGFEGRFI